MSDFQAAWGARHDAACEVKAWGGRPSMEELLPDYCRCYRRWLEGRLGEMEMTLTAALKWRWEALGQWDSLEDERNDHAENAWKLRTRSRTLLPPTGAGDE